MQLHGRRLSKGSGRLTVSHGTGQPSVRVHGPDLRNNLTVLKAERVFGVQKLTSTASAFWPASMTERVGTHTFQSRLPDMQAEPAQVRQFGEKGHSGPSGIFVAVIGGQLTV
jgi:hypothetical protein